MPLNSETKLNLSYSHVITSTYGLMPFGKVAQSDGALEYTDCTSAEG